MPNFTVTITNANAGRDGQAARYIIARENERRAALDPPGDPLLTSPNAVLLTSYQTALGQVLSGAHDSYVDQAADESLAEDAKARWKIASDAERAAALAELPPRP